MLSHACTENMCKQDGFTLMIQLGKVLGGLGMVGGVGLVGGVGNIPTSFIQLAVAGSILVHTRGWPKLRHLRCIDWLLGTLPSCTDT